MASHVRHRSPVSQSSSEQFGASPIVASV
jgi:hypothetical protein